MNRPQESTSSEPRALEHKLAAILYADVAGYSRLTGVDEAGTHRTLSAYLDAFTATIQTHRGSVNITQAMRCSPISLPYPMR